MGAGTLFCNGIFPVLVMECCRFLLDWNRTLNGDLYRFFNQKGGNLFCYCSGFFSFSLFSL